MGRLDNDKIVCVVAGNMITNESWHNSKTQNLNHLLTHTHYDEMAIEIHVYFYVESLILRGKMTQRLR